ncbi:MAG TPA: hypothetical protein VMM60_15275, partial [Ilumatobacter sp.]|nr:hypothetical protein [Ilumatobacter sp.]
ALVAMFPALVAVTGMAAARELVALTALVGMHVPGLHSMFSSLSVEFGGNGSITGSPDDLAYEVTLVDRRFSRATIAVTASSLTGTVVAFVRPSPVEQHVDTGAVNNGEFAGHRWLIVGGSRGLGAAAVRLLTAGGAEVRFTYHRGADDAAAIHAGTGAAAARLDVFNQALPDSLLAALGPDWAPTHLGWFASPPIFVGARGTYSKPLFDRFRSAYVDAFSTAIEHLVPRGLMAALWPSSEAVDTDVPGLAEYADAKRLGELRCRELERSYPPLHIAAPRLPRLLTDQSTSFVPVEFGDTAIEILAALRATLRER